MLELVYTQLKRAMRLPSFYIALRIRAWTPSAAPFTSRMMSASLAERRGQWARD